MTDMSDDWMNPRSHSIAYTKVYESDPAKIEYLIERKKRVIVTGNVGSLTSWALWSAHATAKERDEELASLREAHPMWRLRPREHRPYYTDRFLPDPMSHDDD